MKVTLKQATEEDAEFIYQMMQEKEYKKYYLDRLISKSTEDEKRNIARINSLTKKRLQYYFTIFFGKEKAGVLDIYKISQEDKRCCIGYGVATKYWGKGIATKAVKEALNFLKKEGFHTVEATADPKNKASKRVLEKNGFYSAGILKDYYMQNKKFLDREIYWKIIK
jgi:ribosomal-protein-alanine N-acetyltransferase